MGMAKMPTEFGQAPNYVTLSGGWAYSISAKSQNKDAAFKVLEAANSAQNLALFDVLVGNIGVRKDEASQSNYAQVPMNPYFTSLVAFTQFRPAFTAYPKISNQVDLAMENVMSGTSPKDAMSDYASAVTGIAGAANVETR
jgi:multiple sugar transport system substrate-binding protein